MEFDIEFVKSKVMSIPGVRDAIRAGDYQKVFDLCGNSKKKFNLAQALYSSKIDFLPKLTEIPDDLFRESKLISGKLVIPGNIKKIGDMAFFGTDITELELNEGLEEIGQGAFAQTKIKEVHLPSTIKKVGTMSLGRANVYLEADSLDNISIPGADTATVGFFISETTGEKKKY